MATDGPDELTETHPMEARAEQTHAKWGRLRIVHPADVVTTVELRGKAPRVLGRAPTEDDGVKIAHRTVSRSHVAIEYSATARGWTLRDLGSRNGTWVDGLPVKDSVVALVDGAVLRMGDVLAVFEWCTGELVDHPDVSRDAMFGDSPRVIDLRATIGRVAPDPSPVLIIGDSGTGKELTASELHRLSGRKGPFVTFSCAELAPSVVESQLFGHEKGAFTGATGAHPGLFRSADGGTLFLDEVGELPPSLQPKLLRVLQTGEVMALGSTKKSVVDVRIVAATNRNLGQEAHDGSFRLDLYARLAMHEVRVPALRRRRSDLLGWVAVLTRAWAKRREVPTPSIELAPDTAELLLRAPWDENLRGLDRLVHILAPLAELGPIAPAQLPEWVRGTRHDPGELPTTREPPVVVVPKVTQPDRPPIPDEAALLATLEEHQWVIQAVARHYGRDRRQVYRWMDGFGIKRRD